MQSAQAPFTDVLDMPRLEPEPPAAMAMLAELTHRCPLKCSYCSNPLALQPASMEMETGDWQRVFAQAAAMGVLQVHLSGGEPLARRDIIELVATAARHGLYTNLITSGIQLDQRMMGRLAEAGLDHVQLSFQDADAAAAERVGGLAGAQSRKLAAAAVVQAAGMPLTLNFVVHRQNIANLPRMLALAEQIQPERTEIAHTQFYGWGLLNRDALLPSAAQVATADAQVAEARLSTAGRMVIDYVTSDYHATRPKPCMGGWAQRFLVITPDGTALPCHAAPTLPGLVYPSVRSRDLGDIWRDDPAFQRFRGVAGLPPQCRGCSQQEQDWGGCRCQAMALTGSADVADPVCGLSPQHLLVQQALDGAHDDAPWIYRGVRTASARQPAVPGPGTVVQV